MKKFLNDEMQIPNIKKNKKIKPEYQKMLNNLLGIGANDNTIFATSKTKNFDLMSLIDEKDYEKIFTSPSFKIELKKESNLDLIDDLRSSKTTKEFLNVCEENSITLSLTDRKSLDKSFDETKTKIIATIGKEGNKIVNKWKKIKNAGSDLFSQTNIWPLYVGTMIIKYKSNNSNVYAPLLLKKVDLEITNRNKVYIRSTDPSMDINEKLLFILKNNYNFNLPKMMEGEDYSFTEVIDEFKEALKVLIKPKFDFKREFEFLTKGRSKKTEIKYEPGLILTFSSPSGGKLRETLINFINDNKTNDFLNIDPLRDIQNEVNEYIDAKKSIYRIQPSDISQDKAVIASKLDSTIIWGPPGTGKSQTIANIIANLMMDDKKVIITSEKKAALDVIDVRMGKLSKYIFFGLTDGEKGKAEFYKPFVDLIEKIRKINSNKMTKASDKPYKVISDSEFKFLKQKEHLDKEDVSTLIDVYKKHGTTDHLINKIIDKHKILNSSEFFKNLPFYKTLDDAIELENVKKVGVPKKFPKDVSLLKRVNDKGLDFFVLHSLSKIDKLENYNSLDKMTSVETDYKESRNEFESDIDFIDDVLAMRFKKKVDELSENEEWDEKLKLFFKNCLSGYRLPYKFVDMFKDVIQELFSVFVSTPNTLSSIIDMTTKYDYAIFDESSQLHIENGLPFVGLSEKSIIAGDKQQMRPTSYFKIRDNIEIEEDSEENVDSLLDFAYRKGLTNGREFMLNKNYRASNSELMLFSSKEFYESNLDVIDNLKLSYPNSIDVVEVGGKWEGRVNRKEAIAILREALKYLDESKTVIILTLNASQKDYIESLIYGDKEFIPLIDYIAVGTVKLRNLENIQGDEADVVLVSVAYDKNAKLGSTYVARPEGRNALNVAISRAKEKMAIFKSISANQVNSSATNDSINTFKSWLNYLEMNVFGRKNDFISKIDEDSKENKFKEEVYTYLNKRLLTPNNTSLIKDYSIGSYKIDIALIMTETNEFIFGIDLDDYEFNNEFNAVLKTIERRRFLESKRYDIYKITEIGWKLHQEKELDRIFELVRDINNKMNGLDVEEVNE